MDDKGVLALYWQRDPVAVEETQRSYGRYIRAVAQGILRDGSDAEECANDVYMDAWNSIPPGRPEDLRTYLGKLARRRALDRLRYRMADKRGGGETPLSLWELGECVSARNDVAETVDQQDLTLFLNRFLCSLSDEKRRVFLRRYWYFDTIEEIAKRYGFSESKVKVMLHRMRRDLRKYLSKEGLYER